MIQAFLTCRLSPLLVLVTAALVLLVGVFALRMLLDSVNKDHMLQMFLFLAGLLLALTAAGDREAT